MAAPLIQTFGDKTGIEYELCCKLNQETDSKGNRSSRRGERFETKGLTSRTSEAHLIVVPIPARKHLLLQEFV
jgi:hypothetical protein